MSFARMALCSLLAVNCLAATGCATVKEERFNNEIRDIRETIQAGDEELSRQVEYLNRRIADLELALTGLSEDFDVEVERLETSLRFLTPIYFGFDSAVLDADGSSLLDRFASVVLEFYPEATLVVEGFTDKAGSEEYNLALGQRRADAVRDYLLQRGGLAPDLVRAVSYGEDHERLMRPGAAGPGTSGWENRRVVLVVDHHDPTEARGLISSGS